MLERKVTLSKPVWIGVSIVALVLLANTVIWQKGSEVGRAYDLWRMPFEALASPEATIWIILLVFGIAITLTVFVLVLAIFAGWLIAAIVGAVRVAFFGERR